MGCKPPPRLLAAATTAKREKGREEQTDQKGERDRKNNTESVSQTHSVVDKDSLSVSFSYLALVLPLGPWLVLVLEFVRA